MRLLAAAVCVIALIAFALDAAGLNDSATIGAQIGGDGRVAVISGGPAERAGLRSGDVLRYDLMSFSDRVALHHPVQHRPLTAVIQRGSQVTTVSIAPEAGRYWNAYTALVWSLALLYAAMALLVAWRAPPGRQRNVIITILSALSLAWAVEMLARVIPSSAVHFGGRVLDCTCVVIFLIAAYLFVLWFPPRVTRASTLLWSAGFFFAASSALLYAINEIDNTLHVLPFHLAPWSDAFTFGASIAMIAAVTDGVLAASPSLRRPAIVAGSSLVLLAVVNSVWALSDVFGFGGTWLNYLGLLQWASGFGVSYAILRHRLLDLNLVISRAAIFSAVSLILLGVFALVEWMFTGVFEKTLGSTFSESARTALAASVALFVGLSAGSVHRVVEHRLNRMFFAKRYRALEDLHRFALETDVATDSSALLDLTLNRMRRSLDAQYVALYTGAPDSGYVAVGTTVAELPLRFDQNEETILRLRRWGEAFVVTNQDSHPLAQAYVVPMMLRGTLLGFALCGPKVDRTGYLPDERETVSALVHRVGIAYEWLTRPAPSLSR